MSFRPISHLVPLIETRGVGGCSFSLVGDGNYSWIGSLTPFIVLWRVLFAFANSSTLLWLRWLFSCVVLPPLIEMCFVPTRTCWMQHSGGHTKHILWTIFLIYLMMFLVFRHCLQCKNPIIEIGSVCNGLVHWRGDSPPLATVCIRFGCML